MSNNEEGHVTLETLLDAPGPALITDRCKGENLNAQSYNIICGAKRANDVNTNEPAENLFSKAKSCRFSENDILSAKKEIMQILIEQDTSSLFLFPPTSVNFPVSDKFHFESSAYHSLTDIYKNLQKFAMIKDLMYALMGFFKSIMRGVNENTVHYGEASRLMKIAEDWFEHLPQEIKYDELKSSKIQPEKKAADILDSRETCLRFLNPCNRGIVSDNQRVRPLIDDVGLIKSWSSLVPNGGYREDRRNKVTPFSYMDYGPYASFGPVYDSGSSSCTKESNDLLQRTLWLPARIQYLDVDFDPIVEEKVWNDLTDWNDKNSQVGKALSKAIQIGDIGLINALQVLDEERKRGISLARELDEIIYHQNYDDDFNLYLANALTRDIIRENRISECSNMNVQKSDPECEYD